LAQRTPQLTVGSGPETLEMFEDAVGPRFEPHIGKLSSDPVLLKRSGTSYPGRISTRQDAN
jgi:hypothetical protein